VRLLDGLGTSTGTTANPLTLVVSSAQPAMRCFGRSFMLTWPRVEKSHLANVCPSTRILPQIHPLLYGLFAR
jgi:hypothetical protein